MLYLLRRRSIEGIFEKEIEKAGLETEAVSPKLLPDYTRGEEIMNMVTDGKADLAALPLDLAAKLYSTTNRGVKIIAVNTLGALYLLTGDGSVTSLADIEGKTVYATGKGGYYEYFINHILTQNGIDPENDVTIEYKDQDELTALALDGTAKLCFIPEPYATKVITENKEMKRLVDLNGLWERSAGTKPVQGVVIARTEYIENNPLKWENGVKL